MADEYYLRNPSEQFFYRALAPVMSVMYLRTEYWSWYSLTTNKILLLQRFLIKVFVPVTVSSQFVYLSLHYKEHEFSALAVMFSIIPVGCAVWCKCWTAQTASYKKASSEFMDKFHLHSLLRNKYPEHKLNFIKKTLIAIEKKTRFTCLYLAISMTICYCSWMTVPIIHNFRNNYSFHNITSRLELTVHFWLPFDYTYNIYAYFFLQGLSIYVGGIAIIVIASFDTVNLSFVFHLVGHIDIYKHDLKTLRDAKLSHWEWKEKLSDLTSRYFLITEMFKDIENTFGYNVGFIYAQNLVQGGLLFYQFMSSGRDLEVMLTYGLMIPIFMGMLMLISIVLENVRIQTDDIPILVYDMPWEVMSIPNQKTVLFFLFQVQPRLALKTAFNIETGVQTAINIIKTTFSYYVMIKARNET